MTLSIIVPIHDKPLETIDAVLTGLDGQDADERIVVLDRPSQEIRRTVALCTDITRTVELEGPPGWRSPCIAFNAGLAVATGDITVVCHSDVVMAPGALAHARAHFEAHPQTVLFGKVLESHPELCTGAGHAGPVLCASDHTRALTFLMAAPTQALREIGGWDEAFQAGVCYEDDDLTARLWKHGLDFVFDDAFHATHLSHSRAYFMPMQISVNMALMLQKHGTTQLYRREITLGRLQVTTEPGRTTWAHTAPYLLFPKPAHPPKAA